MMMLASQNGIQDAILLVMDCFIVPRVELAVRSLNASSGRVVSSEVINSEREKQTGIVFLFIVVINRNNTANESSMDDRT